LNSRKKALVHLSWESLVKLGGIGTVLENWLALPDYQRCIGRTLLVSPVFPQAFGLQCDPFSLLSSNGQIDYSRTHNIDNCGYGSQFQSIEKRYHVSIIFGKRYFPTDAKDSVEVEILLLDLRQAFENLQLHKMALDKFSQRLWQNIGIPLKISPSEGYVDYDYYYGLLMAEPVYECLLNLFSGQECQTYLMAYNVLGLPTLYQALMSVNKKFQTIFHADECISARYWIESEGCSDIQFYNLMRRYREENKYMEDAFGDMGFHDQHRLLSKAHRCDKIIATSDSLAVELRFLNPGFDQSRIDVCYHGLLQIPITVREKMECRDVLKTYSEELVGFRPEVFLSHIARPIRCKGLWRDLEVCHLLDGLFAERNLSGLLYIVSSNHGSRKPQDIRQMEMEYHWPRHHHQGFPDLQGEEISLNNAIEKFNQDHHSIKAVLVNSFDWPSGQCNPSGMTRTQFRMAVDVEFGLSMYDAYGISQLESLGFGAICVISKVCGVVNALESVAEPKQYLNILIADYVKYGESLSLGSLANLSHEGKTEIECRVAETVALELLKRLPRTETERAELITKGQQLANRMSWEKLFQSQLMSVLN